MGRKTCLIAMILILAFAQSALAGDFMDTWVTFIFADDNVMAGPEDRSPGAGFQQVDDELFFENLEAERRGQETLTHLVLYKEMPSYFKHLNVEAALVIQMENWVNTETGENETVIGDDGSYLKMNYYFSPTEYSGDNISLTAFPLDSQRFMLGYAYDIAWGGEKIFPGNSGQVPGFRIKSEWGTGTGHYGYTFLGAKSARLLNEDIHEMQTYYGVLGGFGTSITNLAMWEVNGGYFQRGAFPPQGEGSEIGGITVDAYGASTRFTLHQGDSVGTSVDFRLYKNDPAIAVEMGKEQKYDDNLAWSTSVEYTYITQSLLDWDKADTTVYQPAMAGNLSGKFRAGKFRLHGDMFYRDLSYILFNIPGISPYKAFPDNGKTTDEWFVAGGIDYYFERPRLTPGVIVGYKHPGTFKTGSVITVFRDEDDWETLPEDKNAYDIISAKSTLKWDVAPFFSMMGEVRYTLDNNRTKYETTDDESGRKRVFEDSDITNRMGFSLLMQARF